MTFIAKWLIERARNLTGPYGKPSVTKFGSDYDCIPKHEQRFDLHPKHFEMANPNPNPNPNVLISF